VLSDREKLDYLVDFLNYQGRLIEEYQSGIRDRRFTPIQNAERLQELITERDNLYHKELCLFARRCGYEYLPFPAVPHWQRADDTGGLPLTYAPPPTRVLDEETGQVENGVCGFCETEGHYLVRLAFDPAESIYEICPICKGKGRLVAGEPNPQGGNMATVSLVTVEEINAAFATIEADLERAGLEYGPDGVLVQVHTPYACGFTEKEEYIVSF